MQFMRYLSMLPEDIRSLRAAATVPVVAWSAQAMAQGHPELLNHMAGTWDGQRGRRQCL